MSHVGGNGGGGGRDPCANVVLPLPLFPWLWTSISSEQGAYKSSPLESIAPFHQDPAQCIVMLSMTYADCYLIFQVEALLRLAEDCKGSEIKWDEWKSIVIIPHI